MQITTNVMCENDQVTEWHPTKYLCEYYPNFNKQTENYAIVLLNRPIKLPSFVELWNNATIRHCVDGGLNRFIEYKEQYQDIEIQKPDLISGDFDSCSLKAMEYAKAKNCKIVTTPDQNETDFTKALRVLSLELDQKMINSVIVICQTSGRLDQIMANINTLFKSKSILKNSCEIMLFSSNSVSFLLPPGVHIIHIPKKIVSSKYWCGLIPFTKSVVSTKGLKWNLDKSFMEFGKMVSTSNTYKPDTKLVEVTTDNSLLWIMGISEKDD